MDVIVRSFHRFLFFPSRHGSLGSIGRNCKQIEGQMNEKLKFHPLTL